MKKTVMIMVGIICGIILGVVLVFNTFATEMDDVIVNYAYDLNITSNEEKQAIDLVVEALIEDGYRNIEIKDSEMILEGFDYYYVRYWASNENSLAINRALVSAELGVVGEVTPSLSFYIFKEV